MAYTLEKFDTIKQNHDGTAICFYREVGATLAAITASGYFDTQATILATGSIIFIVGSDSTGMYTVTNTVNVITLTNAAGTLTETEVGYLDGITPGTQAANKAVIANADVNTGVSKVTELHIGVTGAETEVTSSAAELNILDGVTSSAAELNAIADVSNRLVNLAAATLTMTAALHGERIITVNKADGSTITLPAATGTGQKYEIYVGTTISSNSLVIQAASAADSFTGFAYGVDTDAEGASGYTWNADAADDTITLDGSATGGIAGDRIELIDIASGIFAVRASLTQSGASEATPFSAAVA